MDILKTIKSINIEKAFKDGVALVKDNLPVIFSVSALGCLGLSIFETAKATHKSDMDIRAEEERRAAELPLYENTELTPMQKVELCWKNYIPVALYGGACAFFIIAAERKGNEKYLAMLSAYELSKKAGEERKDIERDIFGEDKVKEIDSAVRKKLISTVDDADIQVVPGDGEKILYYEPYSNTTVEATPEDILHAFNCLNHRKHKYGAASINDLLEPLSCRESILASDHGWNEDQAVVEPILNETTVINGRPAIVIGYSIEPLQNYGMDHYQG